MQHKETSIPRVTTVLCSSGCATLMTDEENGDGSLHPDFSSKMAYSVMRTSSPSGPNMTSAKRMRTFQPSEHQDLVDTSRADNTATSPFAVDEMFARVPAHVLEEVFDYLDIQQATRLGMNFPCWTTMLGRNVLRNNGIAFVNADELTYDEEFAIYYAGRPEDHWSETFITPPNCVKHLVLIGITEAFVDNGNAEYELQPSLRRVTYVKNHFDPYHLDGTDGLSAMPRTIERITLRDCTMGIHGARLCLNQSLELWQSVPKRSKNTVPGSTPHLIDWEMRVVVASLELPYIFGRDYYDTQDVAVPKTSIMTELDNLALIWPYDDDQVQWLLASLKNLDPVTLEAVKTVDKEWQEQREWPGYNLPTVQEPQEDSKVTAGPVWGERKLKNLDMAFLGRLLVAINERVPIPNFQTPPYPFPNDMTIISKLAALK